MNQVICIILLSGKRHVSQAQLNRVQITLKTIAQINYFYKSSHCNNMHEYACGHVNCNCYNASADVARRAGSRHNAVASLQSMVSVHMQCKWISEAKRPSYIISRINIKPDPEKIARKRFFWYF